MCEASTSYKKDVNVSESNSEELTGTKLVEMCEAPTSSEKDVNVSESNSEELTGTKLVEMCEASTSSEKDVNVSESNSEELTGTKLVEMCEASTSSEKDVNVSESNSEELTGTKLVEMCEASTSFEKDVNVSESNSEEFTGTKLVEMCEASTSSEKDVNVSESNSEELTDTKLVDGKIVNMHRSSPSTSLPIMKILLRKSGPHTCLEFCYRCKNAFRLLDVPLHICRIRSIEKQNEILKFEPSLCADSCLCDFCWIILEKNYKYNKSKNKKEESYSEKKYRLLERYRKKNVNTRKKIQARICSIHVCSQPYCHKMSINEFENIKELFKTFESCSLVLVHSTKQTTDFLKFPFCFCKIHYSMIMVMLSCQICGDKLNAPFNTDDWLMHKMWNCVLIENKLPLVLKPGMFICATCKVLVSKTNPGVHNIDLTLLRGYILTTNKTRLQLYGESKNNLFDVFQGSADLASPIVVPKNKGEKKCVRSTKVKFSDPLITSIYNSYIGYSKNDTESIKNIALRNVAEQNLRTTELQPEDKGLEFSSKEPSNVIVNPVSIKRKQSNVICGTVPIKDVKKQKLNEKHSSNENNSTDNNTTKSYKNKNIAHPKYICDTDTNIVLDSKMLSETDNEKFLPDCEIKETVCIVMVSDDDSS